MKKQEFLDAIKNNLSGFPKHEIEERLNFYSEIIDDKIEEGIDEEIAVSEIGTVDEITKQIIKDIPFYKIAKERVKFDRKLSSFEMLIILLSSPIWFSLLISVIAVIFSLYVALWSVIVSVWACFVSFIAGGFGGIILSIISLFIGHNVDALFIIGASIVLLGLSIITFYGCKLATKAIIILTKKLALLAKKLFAKKEEA